MRRATAAFGRFTCGTANLPSGTVHTWARLPGTVCTRAPTAQQQHTQEASLFNQFHLLKPIKAAALFVTQALNWVQGRCLTGRV